MSFNTADERCTAGFESAGGLETVVGGGGGVMGGADSSCIGAGPAAETCDNDTYSNTNANTATTNNNPFSL